MLELFQRCRFGYFAAYFAVSYRLAGFRAGRFLDYHTVATGNMNVSGIFDVYRKFIRKVAPGRGHGLFALCG